MTTDLVNGLLPGVALAYCQENRDEYIAYSAIQQRAVASKSGRMAKIGRVTVPDLRGNSNIALANLGRAALSQGAKVSLVSTASNLWTLSEQSITVEWDRQDESEWMAAGLAPNQIVMASGSSLLMSVTESAVVSAMTSTAALPDGARNAIWTASTTDPRIDINTAVNAITTATGGADRSKITVAMSQAAFQAIESNPVLLAQYAIPQFGTPTILDERQMAQVLRVGRVVVSRSTWATQVDGISTLAGSYIWTADDVCVYYDAPIAGFGRQGAFGRFFRDSEEFRTDLFIKHGVRSLQISSEQAIVTVDPNAAYLITGVLA